jgi:predicted HNH restriction endonuclease
MHLMAIAGLIFEDAWKIRSSHQNKYLINLFDNVDRYNGIIKAIEINDKIEDAGNPQVKIGDRTKVIQALQLIREDLVRALKTEKILRENKKFVATNSELFATNLKTLSALQISDRASQKSRLLNEALQLALRVEAEMNKLQDRDSTNKKNGKYF